jgi:hypothetical protein
MRAKKAACHKKYTIYRPEKKVQGRIGDKSGFMGHTVLAQFVNGHIIYAA